MINSDENEVVFNEYSYKTSKIFINEKDQMVFVEDNKLILNVDEQYPFTDDDDMARFRICVNDCVIPFQKSGAVEQAKVIDGFKLWKFKKR